MTASVFVPNGQAAEVRDLAGGAPESVADFPGRSGVQEAVFRVGPGVHEFTGPAMPTDYPTT